VRLALLQRQRKAGRGNSPDHSEDGQEKNEDARTAALLYGIERTARPNEGLARAPSPSATLLCLKRRFDADSLPG
jgi:hypothetical protein